MERLIEKKTSQEIERTFRERSLVVCKPETVMLGLHGKILNRINELYLKTILIKLRQFNGRTVFDFYKHVLDQWQPRDEIKKILLGMTHSPVMIIVVEGPNAILTMRKIAGGLPTYDISGNQARLSGYKTQAQPLLAPPGTIRGDHSGIDIKTSQSLLTPLPNFVHTSESVEEYQREIKILEKHGHIQDTDFLPYSKPEWETLYGYNFGKFI